MNTSQRIIHNVLQNTKQWFDLRNNFRCASETATLVAANLLNCKNLSHTLLQSSNQKIARILDKLQSHITNIPFDFLSSTSSRPTEHGHRCEKSAGNILVNQFISKDKSLLPNNSTITNWNPQTISYGQYLASIDLVIHTDSSYNNTIYSEIKCPYNMETSKYLVDSYEKLSLETKSQLQHQLYVTGAHQLVFFVALFDRDSQEYKNLLKDETAYIKTAKKCFYFVVKRDEKLITQILKMWDRLYNFCFNHPDIGSKTKSNLEFLDKISKGCNIQKLEDKFLSAEKEKNECDCTRKYKEAKDAFLLALEEELETRNRIETFKSLITKITRKSPSVNHEKLKDYLTKKQYNACVSFKEVVQYTIRIKSYKKSNDDII